MSETPDTPASVPALRVVRGDAAPEELAALVAVLAAAGGSSQADPPSSSSAWASRERQLRSPLPRHGWRRSSAPR